MKKSSLLLVAALLVGLPAATAAQFGVAGRVGTLGIGGEVAVDLGERLSLRGGLGFSAITASTTFNGIGVELTLPDNWYNVGLDVYLNSAFRVGGGVLFKPDDAMIRGTFDAPVDIGGRAFTPGEIGTLTGAIVSKDRAGYVLVGFGRHTSGGVGLSVDVGAAFIGTPTVTLSSEGGTFTDQVELTSRLEQEAAAFADDMRTYLRIWPILSLGLRIGTG